MSEFLLGEEEIGGHLMQRQLHGKVESQKDLAHSKTWAAGSKSILRRQAEDRLKESAVALWGRTHLGQSWRNNYQDRWRQSSLR